MFAVHRPPCMSKTGKRRKKKVLPGATRRLCSCCVVHVVYAVQVGRRVPSLAVFWPQGSKRGHARPRWQRISNRRYGAPRPSEVIRQMCRSLSSPLRDGIRVVTFFSFYSSVCCHSFLLVLFLRIFPLMWMMCMCVGDKTCVPYVLQRVRIWEN